MSIQPTSSSRVPAQPPAAAQPPAVQAQTATQASGAAAPAPAAKPAAGSEFTRVEDGGRHFAGAAPASAEQLSDAARNSAVSARESRRAAQREAKAAPPPAGASAPFSIDHANADVTVDTIKKLQEGHTDRSEEIKILGLLRGSSPTELNYVISKLNMAELISDIDDRGCFGPDNRTSLLQILSRDRLGDLNVASRASVVDALQRGDTDSNPAKKAVLDIFLGTKGADLTELKNRVDAGSDHHDLQQLLNRDLGDMAIREQILQHIQNDAKGRPSSGNKVLSDVDDTFYVNWVDKSYPKKTVYPGVKQFYNELDRGPAAASDRKGDLGFLTARPWDPVGIFENQTHQMLGERGIKDSTVLTGDIAHLIGNQNIASKKADNFKEYKNQYPEYGFVFIGDSGQGDVIAAKKMIAGDAKAVRGAFIHDVVNTSEAKRQEYRKEGIVFFDTYAGAAVEAFDKGLIQREGMARIAQSAVAEFKEIKFDSSAQKQARLTELQRDVARVNANLPPDQQIRF